MTRSSRTWHAGGCHCGAVRFRVQFDKPIAIACNCSICAKKGMVNLIVPFEDFELYRAMRIWGFIGLTPKQRFIGFARFAVSILSLDPAHIPTLMMLMLAV